MKKVSLTIVVQNEEEAQSLARQMEKSYIAQQGLYVLDCGSVEKLSEEETEIVISELS